jgi:hypothetical protein
VTIARVQHASHQTTGTTNGVTWPGATTLGNLLIAICSSCNNPGSSSTMTITPPSGGGWSTAVGPIRSNAGVVYIFYKFNAASQSATGNFTSSGASGAKTDFATVVCEYSGFGSTDPIDVTANNPGASGTSQTTGTTTTTTQASELWIGGIGEDNNGATFSAPTNSFAIVEQILAGTTAAALLEKIVSSTGTAGCGVTANLSGTYNGAMATFKGSGGAVAADQRLTLVGCGG